MVTAKQAKAIAERYQKAVALVEQGRVFPLHRRPHEYVVLNGKGEAYWVQLAGGESHCDCADYRYRRDEVGCCKHVLAVQLYLERQQAEGRGTSPRPDAAADADEADVVNPSAACQRCGMTVETDRLYCEPCERLVDERRHALALLTGRA